MHHPTTARPEATTRQFVMGPEKVRATILTTGAETDGRHDLIDTVLPARSMTRCTCTPATRTACT
jgi:hypothetical protein